MEIVSRFSFSDSGLFGGIPWDAFQSVCGRGVPFAPIFPGGCHFPGRRFPGKLFYAGPGRTQHDALAPLFHNDRRSDPISAQSGGGDSDPSGVAYACDLELNCLHVITVITFLLNVKQRKELSDCVDCHRNTTDLLLNRNQLLLIVGPSGSGKTTQLSLPGCVLYPTEGCVCIQGVNTKDLNDRRLAKLRRSLSRSMLENLTLEVVN
jgi:hypothetical protein